MLCGLHSEVHLGKVDPSVLASRDLALNVHVPSYYFQCTKVGASKVKSILLRETIKLTSRCLI